MASQLRNQATQQEQAAFAAKIRLVRAALGWSQTELAQRIGLTQSAIHKLEQGETEPAAQNWDCIRRNMASAKD